MFLIPSSPPDPIFESRAGRDAQHTSPQQSGQVACRNLELYWGSEDRHRIIGCRGCSLDEFRTEEWDVWRLPKQWGGGYTGALCCRPCWCHPQRVLKSEFHHWSQIRRLEAWYGSLILSTEFALRVLRVSVRSSSATDNWLLATWQRPWRCEIANSMIGRGRSVVVGVWAGATHRLPPTDGNLELVKKLGGELKGLTLVRLWTEAGCWCCVAARTGKK